MGFVAHHRAYLVLGLLLTGVISNAAVIPLMAVYIVEELGRDPWFISIYSVLTAVLSLIINRRFGEYIDDGGRVAPLVKISIAAFITGVGAVLLIGKFWIVITVGSMCFATSNASVPTMYSFGRLYAESKNLNISRYNAYLRTMTSVGWMLAPAASFAMADWISLQAVFKMALCLGLFWAAVWYVVMPKQFRGPKHEKRPPPGDTPQVGVDRALYFAAATCFFFALTHVLCSHALPLFYIREVGFPTYVPGISLSIKTMVEIVAILLSPWLVQRFGATTMLACSAILALVAFQILANVETLVGMAVGSAFEGLYYGIFAGVGITFMQELAHGRIARATSLYMNALVLGGLSAGSLVGVIAQFADFRSSILLASVGAIAAMATLLAMRVFSRPAPSQIGR